MELYDCINFRLNNAQNAVFAYFKDRLSIYELTPIQYALLKCLWKEDLQTPTQLAQTLRLDGSSITGILDRLEKKDLIQRVYGQLDRRSIQIHLLPGGAALQKPVEETIQDANEKVLAGIDPTAYEIFQQQLSIIEANARGLMNNN